MPALIIRHNRLLRPTKRPAKKKATQQPIQEVIPCVLAMLLLMGEQVGDLALRLQLHRVEKLAPKRQPLMKENLPQIIRNLYQNLNLRHSAIQKSVAV